MDMDEHVAKIVMDMHRERMRLQMGDPVPTHWRPGGPRERLVVRIAASTRAWWGAIGCNLGILGRWLQQRRQGTRLGEWLSGRTQPQTECG